MDRESRPRQGRKAKNLLYLVAMAVALAVIVPTVVHAGTDFGDGVAVVSGEAVISTYGTLFFDDMESGGENWTTEVTAGGDHGATPWAITEEYYTSASHSWSDSPGGDYPAVTGGEGLRTVLTTRSINLYGAGEAAVYLSFTICHDLGDGDELIIKVSGNGGASWEGIDLLTGAFEGTWSAQLPAAVVTEQFKLQFVLEGSEEPVAAGDGVHIDDVLIYAEPPVLEAPVVREIWPTSGPASGGTEVAIFGSNFEGLESIGASAVKFGDVKALSYTVENSGKIWAVSPPGTGSVQVKVTTPAGSSANGEWDDFTYEAPDPIYQQDDPKITYLGQWSTGWSWWASGYSFNSTNQVGGAAIIKFEGTSINVLARTTPWYGKAWFQLDEGEPVLKDFYSETVVNAASIYQKDGLDDVAHTLTIKCAGIKNELSVGYAVSLDALQIDGVLLQARVPTRYQQDYGDEGEGGPFYYMGAWNRAWTWSASGGSFDYAISPGAAVNVKFVGDYLAWYAKTGPWYGKAWVRLDGGEPFLVDLYSPWDVYKVKVYDTGLLEWDTHTLSIYWAPEKNWYSRGCQIDVDAFDIMGEVLEAPAPAPIPNLYEENDPKITYLGQWSTGWSWLASGFSFKSSVEVGAAAIVKFTGTSVDVVARTTPWYGKLWIKLDNLEPVLADLYSEGVAYGVSVFKRSELENGEHTLIIKCLGAKNELSVGYAVSLDALRVTGALEQAPTPTRYQHDYGDEGEGGKFYFTDGWQTAYTWSASGGSYTYVYSPEEFAIAKFEGTYLAWTAKTAPWYGKARVRLDSGDWFLVDLYSPTPAYKQVVYTTGVLTPGIHTLRIEWSPQKNPASWGYQIDVDTFDIIGVPVQAGI